MQYPVKGLQVPQIQSKADFSMRMAGKPQRKNNSSNSYERVNSLQ